VVADIMTKTMPAEWAPQDWVWIGFPHAADLWEADLAPAQRQIAALANAIADTGQQVRLVVRDQTTQLAARKLISEAVLLEQHPYGDIWLRDTGPLTVFAPDGMRRAQGFQFNGWGGKYLLEGDQETGASLAAAGGLTYAQADWILEGGAIDTDGSGSAITTRQCLLNANRNPHLSREEIVARLNRDLGLSNIVWLGDGLLGDHTDGHVDNLARFVAPGLVALPQSQEGDDPNRLIYAEAQRDLEQAGFGVALVPSAGPYGEDDAEPASYMNFVIANHVVVVPTYGRPADEAAVEAIGALFPSRETIGLPANAVLTGGGSFHCASQHVPAPS